MNDSHNLYVLDELIADEGFQNYCLKTNAKDEEYWQNVIFRNWSQRSVFEEAYEAVKILNDHRIYDGSPLETKVVPLKQMQKTPAAVKKRFSRWPILGFAASLLLVAIFALPFFSDHSPASMQMVATEHDESKTISLPDGSTAILNGSSTITYPPKMDEQNRFVTFSGEVFFEVESTMDRDPFTVKSKYGNIVVTGTKFNLKDRGDTFTSTLLEGAIMFQKENMDDILLSPGDQLIVKNNTMKIVQTDLEEVTAWQESRIVFKNRSMSQVIRRLKEDYGLHVEVQNKPLLSKKISANMVTKDPLLLLESIGAIYDFEVDSVEGQIVLK